MITFVVSRGELVLEAFLWFAGAVCAVLVYAHLYIHVRHIAHCLLHIAHCMAQCTAVSGLCIRVHLGTGMGQICTCMTSCWKLSLAAICLLPFRFDARVSLVRYGCMYVYT